MIFEHTCTEAATVAIVRETCTVECIAAWEKAKPIKQGMQWGWDGKVRSEGHWVDGLLHSPNIPAFREWAEATNEMLIRSFYWNGAKVTEQELELLVQQEREENPQSPRLVPSVPKAPLEEDWFFPSWEDEKPGYYRTEALEGRREWVLWEKPEWY